MYKHFSKAMCIGYFFPVYFFSSQKQRTKNLPIQEIKENEYICVCIRKCHYKNCYLQ